MTTSVTPPSHGRKATAPSPLARRAATPSKNTSPGRTNTTGTAPSRKNTSNSSTAAAPPTTNDSSGDPASPRPHPSLPPRQRRIPIPDPEHRPPPFSTPSRHSNAPTAHLHTRLGQRPRSAPQNKFQGPKARPIPRPQAPFVVNIRDPKPIVSQFPPILINKLLRPSPIHAHTGFAIPSHRPPCSTPAPYHPHHPLAPDVGNNEIPPLLMRNPLTQT
jgi:hypothetical protein